MPAFDAYVMVDWSASSSPKLGPDSIWIASGERSGDTVRHINLQNPATRAAAIAAIAEIFASFPGRRILAGFDFPFGYVRGTAAALGMDQPAWRHTWRRLAADVRDEAYNGNNRFDVAESWNKSITGQPFPFWGNVREDGRSHLTRKRFRPHGEEDLPERRLVEARATTAQPVWKMAYTGSVGSQAMLGIPRVWQLRNDERFVGETAIWPFETGLGDARDKRIVLAEIYPSLIAPKEIPGKPKDAGQVTAMVERLAALDAADRLARFFRADPKLTDSEEEAVVTEEAWMLGVTAKGRYWK